ncbi:hypothetical protein C8Q76DRAFT_15096 [Earliella scabrosa]|nr:hypothetical protein C8Q76DRAFT_15096 [Earliella scabrosa]
MPLSVAIPGNNPQQYTPASGRPQSPRLLQQVLAARVQHSFAVMGAVQSQHAAHSQMQEHRAAGYQRLAHNPLLARSHQVVHSPQFVHSHQLVNGHQLVQNHQFMQNHQSVHPNPLNANANSGSGSGAPGPSQDQLMRPHPMLGVGFAQQQVYPQPPLAGVIRFLQQMHEPGDGQGSQTSNGSYLPMGDHNGASRYG